jgi:hypothetical protein
LTVTIEPEGESCDPSVLLMFAGRGKGTHKVHELEVQEGNYAFPIRDYETQYDWMWHGFDGMFVEHLTPFSRALN